MVSVALVSCDSSVVAVGWTDVLLVPRTVAVLVLETDVVPPRTVLVVG